MNAAKLFLHDLPDVALSHVSAMDAIVPRTHAELRANVLRLGRSLRNRGVSAGDPILIICGTRLEAIEAVLAAFHIGAIAMPVSPLLGARALTHIVTQMRPTCCIVDEPPEPALEEALTDLVRLRVSLRKLTDRARRRGWIHHSTLLASDTGRADASEERDAKGALIIHSSGSSGVPKPISFDHEHIEAFFEYHTLVYDQYADCKELRRGAIVIALPVSHLAGLAVTFQGLLMRRPTYVMSYFAPELFLRLVEKARCPFIMLVPSLYRSLLREPFLRTMDTSALRFCIHGGEPCPEDLAQDIARAFDARVATAYSMTEALSGISHTREELFGPGPAVLSSCGQNTFGDVKLVDDAGREQATFGELWVRNRTVRACYRDPALNAERLRDGWFRTGDLFFRNEEGHYFHRGRVDEMFICNGKNIYPADIEVLLMRHPAVSLACAAPVSSPGKGTVPAVLLVTRDTVSESEMVDFCLKHGPSHTVPHLVSFSGELPHLSAGKVDRAAVARLLQRSYDSKHL